MRRRVVSMLCVLSAVFALASSGGAGEPAAGKAALARFKALAGDWEGHVDTPDGPGARIEFRVTGGGSAVSERLFPGTPHEMLTVYHLVGDDLVLTHYCAMGNQPRMKLVAGGAEGALRFDFAGGDNVDAEKGMHMHSGVVSKLTADRYEADWALLKDGKPVGNNRFFMTRAAQPAK